MGFFARFQKKPTEDQSGKLSPRDLRQQKKAAYYTRKNRKSGKAEEDKREPVSEPKEASPPESAPVPSTASKDHTQTDANSNVSPPASPAAAAEPNAEGSRASPTPKFSEESEVETYQPPRIAAANEAEKRKQSVEEGAGGEETEETETSDDRDPPPKTSDPCNICGCFN